MNDLNEQKLVEEIELLKIERKAAKARLYLDLLKSVAVFLGAAVVFWFIQQPESILNRASSKETIARERAKLMLDWIKENDPKKQANALEVIRAAYGESDDGWIKNLELRLQNQAKTAVVNQLLEQYKKLIEKSQILKEELHKEETGLGTGKPGRGAMWAAIRNELESTEFEMKSILEQLTSYGFDVTKIQQK